MPAGDTDATYSEVVAAGLPPASPPPFDFDGGVSAYAPAKRVMAPVHVPGDDDDDDGNDADPSRIPSRPSMGLQRAESMSGNVLVVLGDGDNNDNGADSDRAYWIQRKIGQLTHGSVRIGYVLRRRRCRAEKEEEEDSRAQWEVMPQYSNNNEQQASTAYEMVAIKMYDRSMMASSAASANGDSPPTVEIAASHLLSRHTSTPGSHHVLETVEVLADDRLVYHIVPYCDGGDLFSFVERQRSGRLEENMARHVFKQLLSALGLLQNTGLCHRDVSLEHIMIHGGDCFLSGKGGCIRIPYGKDGEGITDVEAGSTRRLISPQGQCGQPHYMGPVMLANIQGFDAHATDLWSLGIVLFHMLFGAPPFVLANNDDPRFLAISTKVRLTELTEAWRKTLEDAGGSSRNGQISPPSDDVIELLQAMLMADPKDRLTLREILAHPWVASDDVKRLDSSQSGFMFN
mmetsp:Transcript_9910/g.23480  ORF Transcript_9910/g.23480 Transcript_9910/m.23480 type:complete len:459 (-) Transcript_9910:64-1440(-)